MKSPLLVLAILATAAAIGFWQNSRLIHLRQESISLETRANQPIIAKSPRSEEPAAVTHPISKEERSRLYEKIVTRFLGSNDRSTTPEDAELLRNMWLTAARFGPADIGELLQKAREDPRFAEAPDDNRRIGLCLQFFSASAPAATLAFLESHREIARWEDQFTSSFNGFLLASPRDAIRWFDEQATRGNPDVTNVRILQSLLVHEARIDPDKMLARAVSPEFAADPETLSHLGGSVASALKGVPEHQQFLAALRRMQNGSAPPPLIQTLRAEYIAGLSQPLADFRFEDSSVLIDSEFTLDEKLAFSAPLGHRGELADPEKWMDWLLKIDLPTWEKWRAGKGFNKMLTPYPAFDVLSTWTRQDYLAPGEWLAGVPEGALKTDMSLEYAWNIANIDPSHAASYLPRLPEGVLKKNLINKIAGVLDKQDPAAASAFRAENPSGK